MLIEHLIPEWSAFFQLDGLLSMEKMPYLSAMATLEQLQTLLIEDLGEGIDAMRQLAQGTRLENDLLQLAARYRSYEKKVQKRLLDSRDTEVQEARLQDTAVAYLSDLAKLVPDRLTALRLTADPTTAESEPASSPPPTVQHHYHGPVYQNSPITIHQYQDFRQEVVSRQPEWQALGEAELAENLITREEYDELLSILQDIGQTPAPTDEQLPKWRRVLGKVAEQGQKFVGGRLEKGVDAALGQAVKDWVIQGGLTAAMKWLG